MSDYKIKSIGKVDFREYKDVVRVIATKKEVLDFFVFFSNRSIFYSVGR